MTPSRGDEKPAAAKKSATGKPAATGTPAAGRPMAPETPAAPDRRRSRVKPILFIVIVVAIFVLDYLMGWSRSILGEDSQHLIVRLIADQPVLAGLVYVGLSVVGSVALALPGVLFAVVAGTLFGPWWGTLLCWVAMSVGAMGSFLVARYFLKDSLRPRLAENQLLDRFLFSGAERSDVFLLAVTRLVPVFPFNLQNLAYGVTDVSFGHYALYTCLFILPGTAAYSMGAAGLTRGGEGVVYVIAAVAIIVVSMVVASILRKRGGVS